MSCNSCKNPLAKCEIDNYYSCDSSFCNYGKSCHCKRFDSIEYYCLQCNEKCRVCSKDIGKVIENNYHICNGSRFYTIISIKND